MAAKDFWSTPWTTSGPGDMKSSAGLPHIDDAVIYDAKVPDSLMTFKSGVIKDYGIEIPKNPHWDAFDGAPAKPDPDKPQTSSEEAW